MTQPEALRLADAIDPFVRPYAPDHLTSKVVAAELRRLHAENEALQNTKHYEAPPGFVLNPDYLVPELRAQRDALLEAYRKMKNVAAGYSNLCDGSAFTRKLEREFEAADAIARAVIKAVEGEKT